MYAQKDKKVDDNSTINGNENLLNLSCELVCLIRDVTCIVFASLAQ